MNGLPVHLVSLVAAAVGRHNLVAGSLAAPVLTIINFFSAILNKGK